MNPELHGKEIGRLQSGLRARGIVIGLLSGALLVALLCVFSLIGTERTIVIPPTIEKTFWVTKDRVSRSYLEQMGAFIGWLVLDVSPPTIAWKTSVLLEYVSPSEHGAMKTQMDLEADRLRTSNASSTFLLQQLVANENEQSVEVVGRLRRQINGADVGEPQLHAYHLQFEFAGGRVHLKTFKEIPYGPYGQARVSAAAASAVAR
jgi:conjugal transfer pilus assembly protein TraE